jgi:hypothetical protein
MASTDHTRRSTCAADFPGFLGRCANGFRRRQRNHSRTRKPPSPLPIDATSRPKRSARPTRSGWRTESCTQQHRRLWLRRQSRRTRAGMGSRTRAAVVLGAGGAARAVVHALKSRGIRRHPHRQPDVARARNWPTSLRRRRRAHETSALPELCGDAGLVVNTTSLGMSGDGALPADPAWLPSERDRYRHRLCAAGDAPARRRAAPWPEDVDGLGMLLHQAVPGFERWFGPACGHAELRDMIVRISSADDRARPHRIHRHGQVDDGADVPRRRACRFTIPTRRCIGSMPVLPHR